MSDAAAKHGHPEGEPKRLGLFEGFGIELEYMVVSQDTMDVLPVTDRLIEAAGGADGDVERGPIGWSNELVLHVLEFKTNGPAPAITRQVAHDFHASVHEAGTLARTLGGCLLPGGMHPWMDPSREMKLWPHGYGEVYAAYDRIFDCRGHGWSNLQSAHLNLPFANDREFGRLHAAIRLVLPILPALAASSPIMDGRITNALDSRLEVYRFNQRAVPEVTGRVIPEEAFSESEYRERILQPMWDAIAARDPEGTLQEEWLNSRGAIARFERNAVEIRVLDVQECPAADLAVAWLVSETVRALAEERFVPHAAQHGWSVERLARLFEDAIVHGDHMEIRDAEYLALFGYMENVTSGRGLWRHLARRLDAEAGPFAAEIVTLLEKGPLARRMLRFTGRSPDHERLRRLARAMAECLREGGMFAPR